MKTCQKGFISPLLLALIAVLLIGGGGVYVYVQKQGSQNVTAQITKDYPISSCGVEVNVKNGQSVSVATSTKLQDQDGLGVNNRG